MTVYVGITIIPGLIGAWLVLVQDKLMIGLTLLTISVFGLHLTLAAADPFLHHWDERFHALVAKNMMSRPFYPMLRVEPLTPYDLSAWCCSHVWVHKQPLFLWQMALSMKLFGVNELALRLPSALMAAIGSLFTFGIGNYLTRRVAVGFIAAVLTGYSGYALELTSGRYSLDHNDVAFAFYVTASVWAFTRYLASGKSWIWALTVGLFVGMAVLNKWLTGLLIFGGWGLYLLLRPTRQEWRQWGHLLIGIVTALVVFMPWQLYIQHMFPLESAVMYASNRAHITQVLDGRGGDAWYHIKQLNVLYGYPLAALSLLGWGGMLIDRQIDRSTDRQAAMHRLVRHNSCYLWVLLTDSCYKNDSLHLSGS